ncbi:MAG: minor capsid protein [Candidatus Methanomethylophilaceae archaeon]|nr:minor capsid protein [Candidatus Methanomethylophilaceae archaeon]
MTVQCIDKNSIEALREAVQYQDLGKGLGPRLAKCLIRSTDDLLDRIGELVDRHAKELGGSPRDTALWLSSVWGPFDEAWLMQCAASLPEPARGRWVALLASPRFDRNISRRKAIAYASRMAAERLEHDAVEVAGPPLGRVAEEASARTAYQVARSAGLGFSFSMPNEGQIERVLNSAGISKKIKGFSQASVKLVEDGVVRGMMAGSSFEDIARTIRKETPVMSMVRARRIARTMSTDCAAEAKMREYEELGVERYTIVCTLDERTCATCGAMDGRTFPVKGAHPRPSFHPNCRCVVREELSEEWTDRMTRSARDEGGKTVQVPASMTYDEWKRRFAKPAKPSKAQGGPQKANSPKKASQNVQWKKTQQKATACLGNGNPVAPSHAKQQQMASKAPTKQEAALPEGKESAAPAPRADPYSPPPTKDEWDAMGADPARAEDNRKAAVIEKAEAIKSAPRQCTGDMVAGTDKSSRMTIADKTGKVKRKKTCPAGSEKELSRRTNDMVLDGRITPAMADSLHHYTTREGYAEINRPLWRTAKEAEDLSKGGYPEFFRRNVEDIRNIDEAIAMSETDRPMVVHRGMSGSPFPGIPYSDLSDFKKMRNQILPNYAYTSSSIHYETAKEFAKKSNGGRDMLVIHYNVPRSRGVGLFLGEGVERLNGQPMSDWPDEGEFLMKRGLVARVYDCVEDSEGVKHVFVDVEPDARGS